ncbi:MAG TPA: phytanoyl-CoA dioxygenase family protein [Jatrophihabitantaceae bacterium]|nr:phytanoyl-CoA dioxygenase family protein [Jatrophihabitantaceae bacterium]
MTGVRFVDTAPAGTATDLRYDPIPPAHVAQFERDGFLLVPGALDKAELTRVTDAVDRAYAEEDRAGRLRPDRSLHLMGMLGRDPALLDLVDHPGTFRYVWCLMGWNVYSHHNHIDVNPGRPDAPRPPWNWHQDGYRQNSDIVADVRPMLAMKVGFVLSDLSVAGRGATQVILGSHVDNTLAGRPEQPDGAYDDPAGAWEIRARPGDAFVFDRRLWHSRSVNRSSITRKVAFVGYTHRWIRPLDEADYRADSEWFASLSPLRRQLLGGGPDHANHWGVDGGGWIDKTIPLRAELAARGLLDGSRPYLR